jgi:PAS domain S-box-containing protein
VRRFEELKRYVRFGATDESALRGLASSAAPHFLRISEEFYARLDEHEEARRVFSGAAQVARLKTTLCEWMALLFAGPWDDDYYAKRARIGRIHVAIGLPQRFMFGAMDLIRIALAAIADQTYPDDAARRREAQEALNKILDLELAVMLESYREAFVEQAQALERKERSLLEQQLAISEARYQEIVEKAEALIVTIDGAGRVVLFNRRCEEVTGVPRARAAGQRFSDLLTTPEDRPQAEQLVASALAAGGGRFEGAVPGGGQATARVRWHLTTLPGAQAPLLCAIGIEVTEERAHEARARRAERLAALGTMAAGLAHEIRNPLNAAHLQLSLVERRLARPDADGARAAAGLAQAELKRLAGLVEEFLQFARPQALRLERIDLRATLAATTALMAPEAAALGITLELTPGPPVETEIDEERIKQVILNLLRNALEATGRGGRVRLSVSRTDQGARLTVEDDGPGLPSTDAPIFEPFFTTKETGTGLGLAIVHRIAADHGGRVDVESRPGRTVFSLSLP